MLDVTGLHAFYGSSHVLFGVDISIGEGEVIAVLGRNGMGKTTLIRSIMGLLPPREGSVKMDGREIRGRAANVAAKAGIGLVPEGRHIFPNLTTEENLGGNGREPERSGQSLDLDAGLRDVPAPCRAPP